MLTASISREFLGGRCAWLKDQPGIFSLYWAGAQRCNSFSLFKSRRSIIWKGMTTNQPLFHLHKVVQHSTPFICLFFLFILYKLLEAFSTLVQFFFSVTRSAASAIVMTFLLKGDVYNSLVVCYAFTASAPLTPEPFSSLRNRTQSLNHRAFRNNLKVIVGMCF